MQFFISAIQAALPEFIGVELGVGWVHVQRVAPRSWIFKTQANGVGSDDILTFMVKVSRGGRVHVRFLYQEEPFSDVKQEPTGTCHGGGWCYSISGLCDAGRLPKDWNGLCVYQTQQF